MTPHPYWSLERSYASGYDDGGNDIKLYKIDLTAATQVQEESSLIEKEFIPVKKTLLLDFNSIREKLPSKTIDNIEGITFGPLLNNGKRSLIVVSDNNFNAFGAQITQLILFSIN